MAKTTRQTAIFGVQDCGGYGGGGGGGDDHGDRPARSRPAPSSAGRGDPLDDGDEIPF